LKFELFSHQIFYRQLQSEVIANSIHTMDQTRHDAMVQSSPVGVSGVNRALIGVTGGRDGLEVSGDDRGDGLCESATQR